MEIGVRLPLEHRFLKIRSSPNANTISIRSDSDDHNFPGAMIPLSERLRSLSVPSRLFAPVDIAVLVYFRIAFGAIMLWEVWRYFHYGWIARYWIDPIFNFTYHGFDWVRAWPGNGMYVHFVVLGLLAAMIAAGALYRIATVLFFLGFTYMFLLEQARYLNHFYLISLLSFLLVLVPAHHRFSVDAWMRPNLRSETAPAWALWILKFQIGVPYLYGGIAKLNRDWLRGEPMGMWLADHVEVAVVGPLLAEKWVVLCISYGGLVFDLFVVPFLLWRRTRAAAFAAAVAFHLLNAWWFQIGIFPWFMIAATAIYFPPEWPRRFATFVTRKKPEPIPVSVEQSTGWKRTVIGLLAIYVCLQLLVPFRHFLYPGNVNWTEEGHQFSWRMKLRDKHAEAHFFVTTKEGETITIVNPRDFLPTWQAGKLVTSPDMILQFSHRMAQNGVAAFGQPVDVRAEVWTSLNGRELQLLIDPKINIANEKRSLRPSSWILPLMDTANPAS